MRKTFVSTLMVLFVAVSAMAQFEYELSDAPPNLLEEANSIFWEDHIHIEIADAMTLNSTKTQKVTILNKLGDRAIRFSEGYDDNLRVKSIECIIYDSSGNEIEKYRKGDFIDVSAVSGGALYSDSRALYLNYTPTAYPYSISYEVEYTTGDTAFIFPFYPVSAYYSAVVNSSYKITYDKSISFRYKIRNNDEELIQLNSSDGELLFSASNIKPVFPEQLSPDFGATAPHVLFAASNFYLKGVNGFATNWDEFGVWSYDLMSGLDEIPQQTQMEVDALVAGTSDTKEKVKRVYEYMQNKTRYIGVQLGIGGWKPYPAAEVDELGYGDCKGLTNYTMAMLKTQGIDSYFALVRAGKTQRSIDSDFASMQCNHVILYVPLEEEEVWLECTSQTIPFNFLGDFTDDRDVLVLTPEGGVVKHTPMYDHKKSTLETKGTCTLLENGSVEITTKLVSKGGQYNDRYFLEREKQEKKELFYKKYWSYINNIKLESMALDNNKSEVVLTEEVSFRADNYASFAGNDMLVPLNVLNRSRYLPKRYKNRIQPLEISRGFSDNDEVIIKIPASHSISFLPEPYVMKSEYGTYSSRVEKISETELKFVRSLIIYKGEFSKEQYDDYRSFLNKVGKYDNQKMILTKNN